MKYSGDFANLEKGTKNNRRKNLNFLRAADAAEIPTGKMKAVKLGGKDILLANVAGNFYAIDNKCPHAHAPLSHGKLEDCAVKCPLHGATFDVTTGKNLTDAKIIFFKMKAKDAHAYKVKVEDANVLVDLS